MTWDINSGRPIYAQIVELMQTKIVSGEYPAGSRLPSVRELAAEASVNPNTMQKAMTELERRELVFAQRTSGRFITEDKKKIKEVRAQLAKAHIAEFFGKMNQLGYEKEEIMDLIKNESAGVKE